MAKVRVNKDKGKDKSIVEKAKSVLKYATPAVGPALAARDIISRFALSRMAENLDPYDYTSGSGKSSLQRGVEAVALGRKEPERAETEQYIEKGYGRIPEETFKERVDLLQMYAGKPQKYGTIEKSKYAPSEGAEKGKQYYRSKGIEEQIIKNLELDKREIRSEKDLENIIKQASSQKGKKGYVATIPGLGQATYGLKRDDKGLYLSYSDVWDLDPTKGGYKEQKAGVGAGTAERLMELAKTGLKKAGTYVVSAKATPTDVYGRIYFDPKTGKPIR